MLGYNCPIVYAANNLPNGVCDLFWLKPSANRPIRRASLRLYSDVQISDKFASLAWVRRSTDGTGGTAVLPNPLQQGNTRAADTTFVPFRTTPGTLVAGSHVEPILWQMTYPLEVIVVPDEAQEINVSQSFGLCLLAAVGVNYGIAGSLNIFE